MTTDDLVALVLAEARAKRAMEKFAAENTPGAHDRDEFWRLHYACTDASKARAEAAERLLDGAA